jgi:hypothetical protein
MKKYLLLLALPLLLAFRPSGEPEFFAWVEPTQRVDGTVIAPSADISAYILRCAKGDVSGAFNMTIAAGGTNRWEVPAGTFGPGTWTCQLYARDQEARTSEGSLAVEFLVATYGFVVEPAAPTGLSVG